RDKTFTDAISAPDWNVRHPQVCLLSFDGVAVSYAALVRRGRAVASYKNAVRFSHLVPFTPIPVETLEEQVRASLRRYLVRSSKGGGGRVPPATWTDLLRVLTTLRPEI